MKNFALLAGFCATLSFPLSAKSAVVFPIATAANEVQFSGGLAFDGSNYMSAFQAGTTISAQLFSPSGALKGKAVVGSSASFPSGQLTRSLPPAAIAYGGGAYLEVWSDTAISSGVDIFGRRIALSGTNLGAAFPLLASSGSHGLQTIRGLEFGGANFLVVWQDAADEGLYGQLVTLDGALSGPEFAISGQQSNGQLGAMAFDGTNYLVVWENGGGQWNTFGAFVSTNGSPGSPFQISQNAPLTQNPMAVAFDGSNYLVVWPKYSKINPNGSGSKPRLLQGRLVAPDGSFPGNEQTLASNSDDQTFPAVQFGGSNYLLVWTDQAGGATSGNLFGEFLDRSANPASGKFVPLPTHGIDEGIFASGGLLYDGSRFVLAASAAVEGVSSGSPPRFASSEVIGEFIPNAFSPPAINTDPVGVTNLAETTATFTVAAEGPALVYQWYKNHARLAASPRISGVNAATLTISNLATSDAGTYFVVVSNLFGTATSSNAVLTVLTSVVITVEAKPPDAGTVTGGSTNFPGASVTVTATSTNDCYYFTNWTAGGKPVNTNSTYTFPAGKSEILTANFLPFLYEVQTASAPPNGGITSGGGPKDCGASVRVRARANEGFRFLDWSQGGEVLTTNSAYRFTASSNVLLTANFQNTNRPTLTVTSPGSAETTTTNSMVTIEGKARDNVAVTNVYYSVSGSAWTAALSGNDWTNWTATVSLAVGTNIIQIYAVDSNGLDSTRKTIIVVREYKPGTREFPITTGVNIKNLQEHIAFDGSNYLMVFQRVRTGQDDTTDEVAQFVSSSGALVGGLLDLNTNGVGDPPTVAFDGTNYLTGWVDYSHQQGGVPLRGAFVSPEGAVGSVLPLAQTTTADSFGTIVFGGGVYFLMWGDSRDRATNGGHDDIFGAMLTPAGALAVPDFEISPKASRTTTEAQTTAAFDGTNFLAVWFGAVGGTSIHGQFISPAGELVGEPFVIYTNGTPTPTGLSSVVFDGTKYLVLSTVATGSGASETWECVGRFVAPTGQVLTNRLILTSDTGPQIAACAAFDGTNYLVTWNQGLNPFSAGPYSGRINARLFNSNGNPYGAEFTLFPQQGTKVPLLAPVLFDGSQFFAVSGLGQLISPAPILHFTNSIIDGAFVLP